MPVMLSSAAAPLDRTAALVVADHFLEAWKAGDAKAMRATLDHHLARTFRPNWLRDDGTRCAFEIWDAGKKGNDCFVFRIALLEGDFEVTDSFGKAVGTLSVIHDRTGKWLVHDISTRRNSSGDGGQPAWETTATSIANRSLVAWQRRDRQVGEKVLSPRLLKSLDSTARFTYLVGLSNPHHAAFELSAVKLGRDQAIFNVRLYEAITGQHSPTSILPKASTMILNRTSYEGWKVDKLP